jgi:tetratricopeptide (TPR) repeat protein
MDSKKLDAIAHNPPIVLLALLLIAIFGFAAVHRLVYRFTSRQRVLAAQTFYRGLDAQRHNDLDTAITDFRAALSYEPDNYTYELSLAKALLATGRFEETRSYLESLAERAPQDGEVNLQLARLAVHDGNYDAAIRYYHRAIYGLWSADPDSNRRRTRLELVDFLLKHDQRMEAQAELIASAASLPPDPTLHLNIADRFLRAGDLPDALDQYRQVLHVDAQNVFAYAGAGKSAFGLGEFATAHRYLQRAVELGTHDDQVPNLLQTATLVLENDPSRPNLTPAERRHRIVAAFEQAGKRVTECLQNSGAAQTNSAQDPLAALLARWRDLEPRMRNDARNADAGTLVDAMDTMIRMEETSASRCGEPEGLDLALVLIARNREGAER